MNSIDRFFRYVRGNFFVFGLLSLIWFGLRSGNKPSRAVYPCQRVAVANSSLWLSTYIVSPLTAFHLKIPSRIWTKKSTIIICVLIIVGSVISLRFYETFVQLESPNIDMNAPDGESPNIDMNTSDGLSQTTSASNIFTTSTMRSTVELN